MPLIFCWNKLFPNGRLVQLKIHPDVVVQLSRQQAHSPARDDPQETVVVVSRSTSKTDGTLISRFARRRILHILIAFVEGGHHLDQVLQ